jgi:hypothetical protein
LVTIRVSGKLEICWEWYKGEQPTKRMTDIMAGSREKSGDGEETEVCAQRKLTSRQLADYPHGSHTTVHSVCEQHSNNQFYTENYQRSSGPSQRR